MNYVKFNFLTQIWEKEWGTSWNVLNHLIQEFKKLERGDTYLFKCYHIFILGLKWVHFFQRALNPVTLLA